MNVKTLYNILYTLNLAGFSEAILKKDNDKSIICAVDDSETIVVYFEYDIDLPKSIGIKNISNLVSRMKLFDLDKSNIQLTSKTKNNDYEFIASMTIDQDNKEIFHKFCNPKVINTVSMKLQDKIVNEIMINNDDIKLLLSSIRAIQIDSKKDNLVTLCGDKKKIILKLKDSNGNYFNNVIGKNVSGSWENSWNAGTFVRIVSQIIKLNKDDLKIQIGKLGVLYITLNNIEFMLVPKVE